jgi:hypothetical protein
MSRKFPATRVNQLAEMKANGDRARFDTFVIRRIQEYRIQLDERGAIGHEGEAMPFNQLVCMLKRDCRNELPPVSNGILDHIVRHGIKEAIKRGMKELEKLKHA